jgi:alanine dehydrogenase
MPGAVPVTSTLARGVNVIDGRITYEAVAEAHGLEYTPLDDALSSRV